MVPSLVLPPADFCADAARSRGPLQAEFASWLSKLPPWVTDATPCSVELWPTLSYLRDWFAQGVAPDLRKQYGMLVRHQRRYEQHRVQSQTTYPDPLWQDLVAQELSIVTAAISFLQQWFWHAGEQLYYC